MNLPIISGRDGHGYLTFDNYVLLKIPNSDIVSGFTIATADSLADFCDSVTMTFYVTTTGLSNYSYHWFNGITDLGFTTSAITFTAGGFDVTCVAKNLENDLTSTSNSIGRHLKSGTLILSGSKPNWTCNYSCTWYGQLDHGNFEVIGTGTSMTWGSLVSQTGIYCQINPCNYPNDFCGCGQYFIATPGQYFN